jgi:TonB family protein
MVNEFILYSLKSAVIFSLLFMPFYFLRGDTFFSRNRFYLLLIVFLALLLPLLSFDLEQDESRLQVVLSTISMNGQIDQVSEQGTEHLPWLTWGYIAVVGLFLIRFCIGICRIVFLILRNPKEKGEGETIVWMQEPAEFSFFGYIFLSRDAYHPGIHRHERVHVRRKHSVDIMVYELFRCFQWYNPFVWLALVELKTQHEYEADQFTFGNNKTEYQALLLSHALGKDLVHMTNAFNYLTIKKRFNMMNKERSPKRAWIKTLAVLPFVLISAGLLSNIRQPETPQVEHTFGVSSNVSDSLAAEFVGGNDALMKFLASNMHYPEKAQKDKVSGMVVVSFVIDKAGKVKNAVVKRGVSPELDQEALRIVNAMPAWKPGSVNGQPIESEFTLPIRFALN